MAVRKYSANPFPLPPNAPLPLNLPSERGTWGERVAGFSFALHASVDFRPGLLPVECMSAPRFLGMPLMLASVCLAAFAGEPRPMQIEDLFRAKRLSDPQVSPDGRWVAYTVTEIDKAENRS